MTENIDIFDLVEGKLNLRDAIQADLMRLRAMQMRFAERLDRAAEKEERPERLAQLSGAVAKAARAVRQIGVLQLELAGERLPYGRAGESEYACGQAPWGTQRGAPLPASVGDGRLYRL